MLDKIRLSLEELVGIQRENLTDLDRLYYFLEQNSAPDFSRKDYLKMFPKISTATATRDLRTGVEMEILYREGEDRLARYRRK
jgi:Fic family protein